MPQEGSIRRLLVSAWLLVVGKTSSMPQIPPPHTHTIKSANLAFSCETLACLAARSLLVHAFSIPLLIARPPAALFLVPTLMSPGATPRGVGVEYVHTLDVILWLGSGGYHRREERAGEVVVAGKLILL